ncbi:hypothetical protein [Comamonas thiooxydans]|uniref:hypothetical protein n=1 Tax=Comamonas thiooxydans TaxID=363952 RepID=UPI0011867752|nr:hypothetical protein [Comamonas thiooxydans]
MNSELLGQFEQAIQNNGLIAVPLKKYQLSKYGEPETIKSKFELIKEIYYHKRFVIHRLSVAKVHANRIDAKFTGDINGGTLTFHLGKLLCLPGLDYVEELGCIRDWLTWLSGAMLENHQYAIVMCIDNNRAKNKSVYGSVRFQANSSIDQGEGAKAQLVETLSEDYARQFHQSAVIAHFVREVALSLGKIGPWSWHSIGEEAFFDQRGPNSEYLWSKMTNIKR